MDNLTIEDRKKNMQNIRSSNTKPERIICRKLSHLKIYFVRNSKTVFGKPDIVFRRKKIAVFIDSDFWHCNKKKFKMPKTNRKYWKVKIESNVKRDKLVKRVLKQNGWTVLRFWESSIYNNPDRIIKKIITLYSQ